MPDVNIQRVAFNLSFVAPDRLNTSIPRYDAPRITHQEFQENEFGAGEGNIRATALNGMLAGIQHDIAHLQVSVRLNCLSARQGPTAGEKHLERKWLREVIISSGIQPGNDVIGRIAGREHQDGVLRAGFPQLPDNSETIESGQHDIENEHIKVALSSGLQPMQAI